MVLVCIKDSLLGLNKKAKHGTIKNIYCVHNVIDIYIYTYIATIHMHEDKRCTVVPRYKPPHCPTITNPAHKTCLNGDLIKINLYQLMKQVSLGNFNKRPMDINVLLDNIRYDN